MTKHTEVHPQPDALLLGAKEAETWEEALEMC